MASARQGIDDAVYAALDASTSIGSVGRGIEAWHMNSPDDFPSACIVGGPDERRRLSYPHATASDMECIYPCRIFGAVQLMPSNTTSRLDELKTDLGQAIEKAIVGSTALDDLVGDVTLMNMDVDDGGLKDNRIGLVFCDFVATYFYNHNTP